MKYTLLEMVQDVLSSMDSDEVNSISDTIESMQVARVIRSCFFDVVNNELPEFSTLFQLEASGTSTKPVMMTRPTDVRNIMLVKYDKADEDNTDPNYTRLIPLSIEAFFDRTHTLNLSEDNVASMTHAIEGDSFTFLYRNDKAPDYYTIIDDHTVFFDSYDSEVDTTLQKVKTFCVGEKEQTFYLEDTYELPLDEQQHVWLLNEAKSLAYQELKQQTHAYAEKTAKRQRIKAQRQKYVNRDALVAYNQLPIFGRRTGVVTSKVIMH